MRSIIIILYYISNKGLLEECDKEENVEINGGCYYFLFEKKTVKRFVQCHVFAQSPPGRHSKDKYPVKTCAAPDLCKNVSLTELFDSNGSSYTISTTSDMCVHIHIFFTTYSHWCGKRNKKKWDSSKFRVPRKSFRVPFWTRVSQVRQPWSIPRQHLSAFGNWQHRERAPHSQLPSFDIQTPKK
jgi:hypothetical protein